MTPIQKLKEENMLLRKGLNDALDALNEVHFSAVRTLENLNETAAKRYGHMNNMYDVDRNYMMEIGRYAWGERGKQIAGHTVRPIITKTLNKLNKLDESTCNTSN